MFYNDAILLHRGMNMNRDPFTLSSQHLSINSNQLIIRTAKSIEELTIVMNWAVEEGWNVGKYDAKAYYKAFPTGCRLLLHEDKIVGGIFLAEYNNQFTFIGLFIVEKNYRDQGLGKLLWDDTMKQLEKMTSIGLYAVPQQVSRYQKSDFKSSNDILRWETQMPSNSSSLGTAENTNNVLFLDKENSDLILQVDEYDNKMFRMPRFSLIKAMLEIQQVVGFAVKEQGKVVGYGIIRPCQKGHRIGPLYANNFEDVKNLTLKLLDVVRQLNTPIIFDAPSPELNKFITAFAEYFNLQRVKDADTQAMFKGEMPKEIEETTDKLYAICSLELG